MAINRPVERKKTKPIKLVLSLSNGANLFVLSSAYCVLGVSLTKKVREKSLI